MPLLESRPTVCLDAGHGPDLINRAEAQGYQYNYGSSGNGLHEQALSWQLAQDIIVRWPHGPVDWFQTRPRYWDAPTLEHRAKAANAHGCDLFVSIHFNWFKDPIAQGLEVWHYPTSVLGQNCSNKMLSSLVEATGAWPRGVMTREEGKTSFYVLRHTHATAILVEMGFLSNTAEAAAIASRSYWDQMVAGVISGIYRCVKELKFKMEA